MMLSQLDIPHILTTSEHDLSKDFYTPCLTSSVQYSRGVGFFTSGWLKANMQGIETFASNNGYARLITSPILESKDWDAIRRGYHARSDEELETELKAAIKKLQAELGKDISSLLSWLIYDGILDLKFALPANKLSGDFHDKFGIFKDELGNSLSFNGSYNDSAKGLRNYESIKVFRSWLPHEREDIEHDTSRFERLWSGEDPNVNVFPVPAALKAELIRLRNVSARPYEKRSKPEEKSFPSIPDGVELRPYQKEAIQRWFSNNGRGLFEMATGTGKTFTALAALVKLADALRSKGTATFTVVICPFINLVDQWADEMGIFGFKPVRCYGDQKKWRPKFVEMIAKANWRNDDSEIVVTTNATYRQHIHAQLEDVRASLVIVIDEMHNFASDGLRKCLPNADFRIGLSATPEIWYRSEVTDELIRYFHGVVFKLDLDDAIRQGFLVPYIYNPLVVELTDHELGEYLDLSKAISRCVNAGSSIDEPSEALTILLTKRARILSLAANKLPLLRELMNNFVNEAYQLVYCGAGRPVAETTDEETRQIDDTVALLGNELSMHVDRYTSEQSSSERRRVLREFRRGELKALVAIRCLDEGIDISEIRRAFILSSSVNPRQWIQRRGRILRRAEGKDKAEIFDFLAIPPAAAAHSDPERNLVRRELLRASEFCKDSLNELEASARLLETKQRFNLLDI